MQQTELIAGDSLNFLTTTPGYSAADGWVLKYRLNPRASGGTSYELTGSAEGADHRITIAASTTALWDAGAYAWAAWVELGAEKYTVQTGQLTVNPDPRTVAAGVDQRAHAEKVLDAIEAVIEGRASQAHEEYQINGRQLKFTPLTELLKLRDRYRWEVRSLRAAAAGSTINKLQVRL